MGAPSLIDAMSSATGDFYKEAVRGQEVQGGPIMPPSAGIKALLQKLTKSNAGSIGREVFSKAIKDPDLAHVPRKELLGDVGGRAGTRLSNTVFKHTRPSLTSRGMVDDGVEAAKRKARGLLRGNGGAQKAFRGLPLANILKMLNQGGENMGDAIGMDNEPLMKLGQALMGSKQ